MMVNGRASSGRVPVLALMTGAGAAIVAGFGWAIDPEAFFAAWLFGFLLWTGLAIGCLGLLMIAHLLGEAWVRPIRIELEAGARTLPLLGVLAIPLLLGLSELYPWARTDPVLGEPLPAPRLLYLDQTFFILRFVVYFVIWSVLAHAVARPGRHPRLAALGLVLLLPTTSFFSVDWIMSLDPEWLSSLFGLIYGSGQLVAALAGAILVAMWRRDPDAVTRVGALATALIALTLLSVYLQFTQYLVVWAANLPHEVAWYLARGGGWVWIQIGLAGPAAVLAVLLLLRRRGRAAPYLLAAAALLLAQHPVQLLWHLRPAAAMAALHWLDGAAVLAVGGLWLALFAHGLRSRTRTAVA